MHRFLLFLLAFKDTIIDKMFINGYAFIVHQQHQNNKLCVMVLIDLWLNNMEVEVVIINI